MQPAIHPFKPADEYYISENCHIIEHLNTPADPACSIARARIEPKQTTRWHRLKNTTERYHILSGNALVQLADQPPRQVAVGDTILIPPNCPQRITNTTSTDLLFLAICTPRFLPENYEDIDPAPKFKTP